MFHQLCLNHGIQLEITDIIYKKNLKPSYLNDVYLEFTSAEKSDQNLDLEKQEEFKTVLNNVHKIVKLIKKSAVKTCLLQNMLKWTMERN